MIYEENKEIVNLLIIKNLKFKSRSHIQDIKIKYNFLRNIIIMNE